MSKKKSPRFYSSNKEWYHALNDAASVMALNSVPYENTEEWVWKETYHNLVSMISKNSGWDSEQELYFYQFWTYKLVEEVGFMMYNHSFKYFLEQGMKEQAASKKADEMFALYLQAYQENPVYDFP